MGKRKITLGGVLKMLEDISEDMFPMSRIAAYRKVYAPKYFDMEDYFPSEMTKKVNRLARKGWVEKKLTKDGMCIYLTEAGKKQALLYDLDKLTPKREKWDGKWRIVFFDVEEGKRKKRNELRKYLRKLGFMEMQRSVYVCPFDCENELKYLRGILNVADDIKMGVLEKIENDSELRKWFKLS